MLVKYRHGTTQTSKQLHRAFHRAESIRQKPATPANKELGELDYELIAPEPAFVRCQGHILELLQRLKKGNLENKVLYALLQIGDSR